MSSSLFQVSWLTASSFQIFLKNKFSFAVFYQRRVRRLFPAMFTLFLSLLSVCFFLFYQKEMYQQLVSEVKYALLSIINFHFYWRTDPNDDGYWGDQSQTWPLLHFWSLAVQQQFYLVTPVLLKLLSKIVKQKQFLLVAFLLYGLIMGVSFILSVLYTQTIPMFAFYLIACRAWELGLGAALAIVLLPQSIDKIKGKVNYYFGRNILFKKQIFNRIALQIISWLGLGMIVWSYMYFNDKTDAFPGYKALVPCMGTVMFIGATFVRFQTSKDQSFQIVSSETQSLSYQSQQLRSQNSEKKPQSLKNQNIKVQDKQKSQITLFSARILSLKPIVWIGTISYSLYLWHWPIWLINIYCSNTAQVTQLNKLFILFLTFIVSNTSTQWIQNPIRKKNIVPTKMLWYMFSFCWIATIIYLSIANKFQIGGAQQNIINQKNQKQRQINGSSLQNYFLYPLKDIEGVSILNPYMNYDIRLMDLQTIKKTPQNKLNKYDSLKRSKDNIQSYQSYFVNMKKKFKINLNTSQNVCIMTIGSSHTQQHSLTIQELAQNHNISLMISVHPGQTLQPRDSDYHKWKITEMQLYKPRIIFAQQYWIYYRPHAKKSIKDIIHNIINPLLNLSDPPDLIVLFGGIPSIDMDVKVLKSTFPEVLNRLYKTEAKQSWNFVDDINTLSLEQQIQIENQVNQIISENYDTNIVKFYPHIHQLLQNPYTGKVQLFDSQVNGQYLFFDNHHVTSMGSRRYKNYIELKVFENAKSLCKNQQ